ncbi:MAG: urocanate hydratase [Myxococcales bacterium]|nr:urocanate hydratase [Myxococcales bacterium]
MLRARPRSPRFAPGSADERLALENALRYVDPVHHAALLPEFLAELRTLGRIYGYRFRPAGRLWGRPLADVPGRSLAGRALRVMIDNNLDFEVALYPYELVTYGESGQVCQNWMQYQLLCDLLAQMTEDQTLVVSSGHPLGLFPARPEAPRAIVTNGLVIGRWDTPETFQRLAALGCVNYGQMTAGGWMYIGSQGIVHGTYITLLNAARRRRQGAADMRGQTFISSGLGGMSGAQPKALELAGGAGIIAEVRPGQVERRLQMGWVGRATTDVAEAVRWMLAARDAGAPLSVAWQGNIVELLEYLAAEGVGVDLISDQTSCHEVYTGGYIPAGHTVASAEALAQADPAAWRAAVDASLRRQYQALAALTAAGSAFFDYGNKFLDAVADAGVPELRRGEGFIWPSYVEDIMGPECFDLGYGPFRWVCLSGDAADLARTDAEAAAELEALLAERGHRQQDQDNLAWIRGAEAAGLVMGTQARILYADAEGRSRLARRFNALVRKGAIGPVMLGRDHHDVSGTDSPLRETSNIRDGSAVTADMAHQCWAGNVARGMTLAVLSNGGGVGTGNAVNGGFGLLLDGSTAVDHVLETALEWDVMGGVARRAWARNPGAQATVAAWNAQNAGRGHITEAALVDPALLAELAKT